MADVKKTTVVKKAVVTEPEKVKEEIKAAVAEKKAAAPAKKAEPAKKAAAPAKKAAAPAKKAAAPAKKAAAPAKKAEVKASLSVQFQGKDYSEATLLKMAKDAYKKAGNKDELKTINIYANVDDQMAYFVANGSIEGKFEI